jgi:spore coat polysaccharide biosynthesis protein SpsF
MSRRLTRNICITIEARMTSSRLPGKMLMEIGGMPALAYMVERVRRTPSVDRVVLATTVNDTDDPLVALADELGIGWHRGSEEDVLGRVLDTARAHDIDAIVELTGDCCFMAPGVVEEVIQHYLGSEADYVANFLEPSYPSGMQAQIYATDILADVDGRTDNPDDREHVSLFIYRNPEIYRVENVRAPASLTAPDINLTLDWAEDLDLMRQVHDALAPGNPHFGVAEIVGLFRRQPDLKAINSHRSRVVV